MEPFVLRIVEEKEQLDEKIEKLDKFMNSEAFAAVSDLQRSTMGMQLEAMRKYSDILLLRLKDLQK